MTPLQKLPKNVGDLGKLIVAKDFKNLPKVQKIAQSGHTGYIIGKVGAATVRPTGLQSNSVTIDYWFFWSFSLDFSQSGSANSILSLHFIIFLELT